MAYAFNEDRSKVDVYTADQIDEMDLANDGDLQDEIATRAAADNLINARFDTVIGEGSIRELLFESTGVGSQGTLVLEKDPHNYDCLEVIVSNNVSELGYQKKLVRIPVENGSLIDTIVYDSTSDELRLIRNTVDFTTLNNDPAIKLNAGHMLRYDESDGTFSYSLSTYGAVYIYAVYGIKYAQDCSAEVADIRVGYDGTVYTTAGEAIRNQIDNIHTILDGILESINSNALLQ